MKKQLWIIIIFFWGFSLLAYPCRCREFSVEDAVKTYEVVFKGKVLSVDRTSDYASVGLEIDTVNLPERVKRLGVYASLIVTKIKVDRVYKGECGSDTILVLTPTTGASCGYQGFEAGYDYIVYGMTEYDPFLMGAKSYTEMMPIPRVILSEELYYWTNNCSRTQVWLKEEEREILSVIQAIEEN